MFEGVSKDDVNYHMLIHHKPRGQNLANVNRPENLNDGVQMRNADVDNQGGDNSAAREVNQLILIYPNGIICIYDNIL